MSSIMFTSTCIHRFCYRYWEVHDTLIDFPLIVVYFSWRITCIINTEQISNLHLQVKHHTTQSMPKPVSTCRLGWHPRSRRVLTTPMWPLLTPMCSGVCLRLLRALRSAPPRCSCSMTLGSSPKAAWWTARSPSLSWQKKSKDDIQYWPGLYLEQWKLQYFVLHASALGWSMHLLVFYSGFHYYIFIKKKGRKLFPNYIQKLNHNHGSQHENNSFNP